MSSTAFDHLSIQAVYLLTTVLMLAAYLGGYRCGQLMKKEGDGDNVSALGPVISGLLGMMAFVLAFSFSIAADHHGTRRQRVLDEANAVTTAYLRADLMASAYKRNIKALLREYVDIRLQAATGGDRTTVLARSLAIHDELWAQVSAAAVLAPSFNTNQMALAITRVIEMHESRLTAAVYNRIPGSVWLAITVICLLTMFTMGYQAGLSANRRLAAILPMSMAFAALLALVVDLNRPQQGLITVGQQAMEDLQQKMATQ